MAEKVAEAPKAETLPEGTETPPQDAKAEPKPALEPDWKARAEAAEAKVAKAENDQRSRDGSRQRDQDIRDKLTTLGEFLGHQNEYIRQQDKKLDILAKALGIEDKELGVLREERQGVERAQTLTKEKLVTSQRAAEFQEWLQGENGPLSLFQSANTGADGNPILAVDGPELAAANQRWIAGHSKLSEREVTAALFDAMNIINRVKREREKAAAKAAPVTPKPTKPANEEEPDLDLGPGAGGLGRTVSADKIDAAWMDWERKHPDEPNPYDKQYRAILGR